MPQTKNEPIAIIGSACRFAGDSSSPSKLWELLRAPEDVVKEIPRSRFHAAGFHHTDGSYHGHMNVEHSYFLEQDVTEFDAEFFGIKPVEAKAIDPQHRLLLEVAYESLESAGLQMEKLKGSNTAVYSGQMCNDYDIHLFRDYQAIPTYFGTGISRTMASNRLSYFFDWHGPSMTIDTACSSSMIAVHLAVQSLRSGDCGLALACGSNLLLGPENYVTESKLKMLSPNGRSRMWDKDADGYARGDGVAVLVLKTLSQALKDGDHIECLVRETGTNQDGNTKGITMPSATAQKQLIRETYAKAGLDISKNPCQYFEAHGTGTPAGDPIEAQAIKQAFFGDDDVPAVAGQNPLYVGSIKTVLGHTEGTAGIAALLKASLALQHGVIPPNLHFRNLSPQVAPFYNGLQLPTKAQPWPSVGLDGVRRASVNSFGFGGSNAHAILESFSNDKSTHSPPGKKRFSPFVFSAASETSLRATLETYAQYLSANTSVNEQDLAWNLGTRRSVLPYRLAICSGSVKELSNGINEVLKKIDESGESIKKVLPASSARPRILGVFTGQGAQYPRMAAELIETSPFANKVIETLEAYLDELPQADRPTWSLKSEILAESSGSRLGEAELSQPVCTAIQILVVDMLRLANVEFTGVVGHSSGEIGAAYAAGILSARDALLIAYYRGLHSRLAASPNGGDVVGAMLAVGCSMEYAEELCALPEFVNRVGIAACNSSDSVTLSGDLDAIVELEEILEDEKKFKRRLKVNKAYHSLHMNPCSKPYIQSLQSRGIKVQDASPQCTWFSSVYESDQTIDKRSIGDVYWSENMTKPVLFSQAIARAVSDGNFDLVIEVGPHPALKGPASQTIQDTLTHAIPYSGTLARNKDAVAAISETLGFLWSHEEKVHVDIAKYERMMSGTCDFSIIKDLPTYQWNHERTYWHESRQSRAFRQREHKTHPLLGDATSDSSAHQLSWRNLLRAKELPWVNGHQLQGKTVFPAAGYIVTALEAAKRLTSNDDISLIDIQDFNIQQAIVLEEDDDGVEIIVNLSNVDRSVPNTIKAHFTYSAAANKDATELALVATANITVSCGQHKIKHLAERGPSIPHMVDVAEETFYSALADLGYNYSGDFRALSSLRRKLGKATGCIAKAPTEEMGQSLLIHPSTLDCALQSVILAFSYPNDGCLWSLHVPTSISRIRVDPAICSSEWSQLSKLTFESSTVASDGPGIYGDVDMFAKDDARVVFQIQGMRAVPFTAATERDDKKIFSTFVWDQISPDGNEVASDDAVSQDHCELASVLDRVATFFLREFEREAVPESFKHYLNYAKYVNELQREGKHAFAKKEWLNDTLSDIVAASERFAHTPDVQIMRIVGEQMPRVFKGETTILEHLRSSDLLDRYYVDALGYPQFSKWLAGTVKQISHRYPSIDILEIGAGTGGATKKILGAIGRQFSTYTFTDISSGFFENARETFREFNDRMVFKTFNADCPPDDQGFKANSYDLIVASFVIHATKELRVTLANARRLLKPGGFLVLAESTNNNQARNGFIFGTLPGWWAGVDEGRTLSPCISAEEWDDVLRSTGFSGIDTITPSHFNDILGGSVFVSQAIDDNINFLREPLMNDGPISANEKRFEHLAIVGGKTLRVSRLAKGIEKVLKNFASSVAIYKDIEQLDLDTVSQSVTVISLTDLDEPVFSALTPAKLESLKALFGNGINLTWITSGRRSENPQANIVTGFGRTAAREIPDLRLQFLDFEDPNNVDVRLIAEYALRNTVISNQGGTVDLLWTFEPETVVDIHARQLIPRLTTLPSANNRYNSTRRRIEELVDPSNCVCEIYSQDQALAVHRVLQPKAMENPDAVVQVQSTLSIAGAIRIGGTRRYLSVGVDKDSGKSVVAFSESLASIHSLSQKDFLYFDVPPCGSQAFIERVAAGLVARAVLDSRRPGELLVVHEPHPLVAESISRLAAQLSEQVIFSADRSSPYKCADWILLSPHLPLRDFQQLLPKGDVLFWDFSTTNEGPEDFAIKREYLPQSYRMESITSVVSESTSRTAVGLESAQKILALALTEAAANSSSSDKVPSFEVLSMQTIASGQKPSSLLSVVGWKASESISIHVSRLDSRPILKPEKTYWLVGLSGTLGLSLCDWMLSHGATHLVITSRNPGKIESAWLNAHRQRGFTVEVLKLDITNEEEIYKTHRTIKETMPPIAGVVQGAMVLRDTAIRDMTFDQMMEVLMPRVNGSMYLDKLFGSEKLDFFVLLSSMTGVVGNIGQANYAASNTFMASLAANRRKRGLAASVINVGAIIGAGYVTREVTSVDSKRLHREGMTWLSEEDFHQMFAEAVYAGELGGQHEPEISTGLCEVSIDSLELPTWHNDPKFSKFIMTNSQDSEDASVGKSGVSIHQQLQSATTQKEVFNIIKETFVEKLRILLQVKTDPDSMMEMRSDELGIDSLIAVEVRSWFLKNCSTNVAVLTILSGVTISQLVDNAVQNISAELIPNVQVADEFAVQRQDELRPPPYELPSPAELVGSTRDASDAPSLASPSETPGDTPSETDYESESGISPEPKQARTACMSFSQSMFWIVHSIIKDKTTLNHSGIFRVSGPLRVDDLDRAVRQVGQHHEVLRTRFFVDNDQQVRQGILESTSLKLEREIVQSELEAEQVYQSFRDRPFDLSSGELIRIRLLSISPTVNYLLFACHHIIFDGISQLVVIKDLETVYQRLPLNRNVLQYADYAQKQRADVDSGIYNDDIKYWKNEFLSMPEPLPLSRSLISMRQPVDDYDINTIDLRVDSALAQKIRDVSTRFRVTSFHFYLTAFKVLLERVTGAVDFSVGIADGNRKEEAMLSSVGPYVNLLPLHFKKNDQTFGKSLGEVRRKVLGALTHSQVPFEVLLKELRVTRSPSHSPIFQAFVDYRQGTTETLMFAENKLEMIKFEPGKTAYDVSLDIIDNPGGEVLISVMVQDRLYSKTAARHIADLYEDILREFAEAPLKMVDDDWQFRSGAIENAVRLGRGESFTPSWTGSIANRFADVVKQYESKTAIMSVGGGTLSYGEVANRVNAIASKLLQSNVGPHNLVGVFQEPTANLVCSFLAITKVAAIYVPLDPGLRDSRLANLVASCKLGLILTDASSMSRCPKLGNVPVIQVDRFSEKTPVSEISSVNATSKDSAVLLHTSGTTGTPKGVLISHTNLMHEVEVSLDFYSLNANSVVLQQSSLGFDMSVLQILLAVLNGGAVCMTPRAMRGDAVAIAAVIAEHGITFTCATPSEYGSWIRFGDSAALNKSSWTAALSGGEMINHGLLSQFKELAKADLHLFNGYGPTETTCCSTKTELNYQDSLFNRDITDIGRPSPNEWIYVVDESLRLLPQGLPGEIVIGGAGVTSGYYRDIQQQNGAFLPDRNASELHIQHGWSTMYRTKDRGHLSSDGKIVLHGRIDGDTQIKLRGMRLDLRDIEQAIVQVSKGHIAEALLSTRSSGSAASMTLVGHVVLSPTADCGNPTEYLKGLLAELPLPQYMIPAVLIPIGETPRTPSGKLDRRLASLLDVPQALSTEISARPTTETEVKLQSIWEEVLQRNYGESQPFDLFSDFFHVGGTSLSLIEVQALIRQHFSVSIPLLDLFGSSTLNTMAQMIDRKATAEPRVSLDWDMESAIPNDFLTQKMHDHPVAQCKGNVVLTGVTGFLGRHILRQLLSRPQVEKVMCIGVRQLQKRIETKELPTDDRIFYYAGDLRHTRLGLSVPDAEAIFGSAEVVIHNAAEVSHLQSYQTLRAANVTSTMELARLCLPRKVPIHYVSTAGVSMLAVRKTFDEVSVQAEPPPTDGSDGYTATKWASERFLEKLNAAFPDQHIWIHRPSSILRPAEEELDEQAQFELLQSVLRFSRTLKAVPERGLVHGYLDMVLVENASSNIVEDALADEPSISGVQYRHQTGDIVFDLDYVKEYLENESGEHGSFMMLPVAEWTAKARAIGLKTTVAALFENVDRLSASQRMFPKFIKNRSL